VDRAIQPDSATPPDIFIPDDRWTPDKVLVPDTGGPTTFKWVVSAGGTSNDQGNSIAVDGSGNIYVTGRFSGAATFGSTTLTSGGSTDIFVAKVDHGGKFVWAISAGGSISYDEGNSIAVDGSGSVLVAGSFTDTATFGSTTLISKGGFDVFVAKVDGGGKYRWAVSAGGGDRDDGFSIAVDGSGNSYVTGKYQGTTTFGSTTLTTEKGGQETFVAKLDRGGKFLWSVSAGGSTAQDNAPSIALDSSGNSYITGAFHDTATYGNTTLTSRGYSDIFVAKLDRDGKFLWAVSAGGTSLDWGVSVALDGSANSYVTGRFSEGATFGSTTLTSRGATDIFVGKLNRDGDFLWAVSAGGIGIHDCGHSISVDGSGNSYITGEFSGVATFGSTTLTSNGLFDVFVAKLDNRGNLGVASASSTGAALGLSISLDGSGNSYLTGWFGGAATFGSTTLTTRGGTDIFVAKLDRNAKF
jgi:hypothetical protein